MTVQTIDHTTGGALELPTVTGGDLPGLAILEQWSTANDHAVRLVSQWIFTDLVPVHHWPMPPGQTLRTMPNPRVYGHDETDEQYQRRCQIAASSAAGTVLRGIAVGLPPNVALEQMHSIRGTIGMRTKAKHALARSRGIKTWDVELSEERVTVAGIDPLTGQTVELTITIEQADRAGWLSNEAYRKTPIDMLWARAMGRLLDRIAGDLLFGLATLEDLADAPVPVEVRTVAPVTAAEITAPSSVARTTARDETRAASTAAPSGLLAGAVRREAEASVALDRDPDGQTYSLPEAAPAAESAPGANASAEAPPTTPEVTPEVTPAAVVGITESQKRKLGDLFTVLGVHGTGMRLRRAHIAGHILGRPLGSVLDCTEDEAEVVLTRLAIVAALQDRERDLVMGTFEGRTEATPAEATPAEAEVAAAPVAEQDLEPAADDPWRDAEQVNG